MKSETAPYFDALEGEIAYRENELEHALGLARKAIARLPRMRYCSADARRFGLVMPLGGWVA